MSQKSKFHQVLSYPKGQLHVYALPLTIPWNYSEQLQENFCLSLKPYNIQAFSREIGIRDQIFLETITAPNLILSANPHKFYYILICSIFNLTNVKFIVDLVGMTNFQYHL